MNRSLRRFASLVFVLSLAMTAAAAESLPRAAPEETGVSSAGVLDFVETVDRDVESLHSVMIVRHGKVIAEGWWTPYQPQSPHMLFSLSKSFTSTGVGLAVSEGKLSVHDPVLKFFPEYAPENPSDNLKAMRVSDLLRMATGHATEPPRKLDAPFAKQFLDHPVQFKPGTHFQYNTPATYMQSAIVQKVSGQKLIDYLRPRLFEPLGIENPTWEECPNGFNTGGYGLKAKTEDIAKFGLTYLQNGSYAKKQLLPNDWVAKATAFQVSNGSNPSGDWDQGYGYQFWRCRHNGYRGDGAFGQYCVVLPEQQAVLAITSGLGDMQKVLNIAYDKLLPAMTHSPAMPANAEAHAKLTAKLGGLTLDPVVGVEKNAEGFGKKFTLAENDEKWKSLKLEQGASPEEIVLTVETATATGKIACPQGKWKRADGSWLSRGATPVELSGPVAGTGGWTGGHQYTAKVCYYETPFVVTYKLAFADNTVNVEISQNVGLGPTKVVTMTGKAE